MIFWFCTVTKGRWRAAYMHRPLRDLEDQAWRTYSPTQTPH